MKTILKYLTLAGRPSGIKEKDFRRFVIVTMLSLFAGLVHLALIPVFVHIGATEMALVNVASVVAWVYGLFLNAKGKHASAILLICTEVWTHSVLAAMYLGLDVGFQHYLWATAALAILNTRLNFFYASLYSFSFVLTFALLYLVFGDVQYDYKYSEYLDAVHFINIMIAGIPFIISITVIRLITVTQEAHMSKLASLDSLTGLYNRRMATEIATKILQQASRTGESVSVVLGDIDYFKKVNDTFGHAEGDHVLSEVALFFRSKLRDADIIARWGGEEFLIVLFGVDGKSACKKIDAVRQSFEQEIKLSSDDSYVLRMSFGVVEYQSGFTLGECLKRADDALYMSKHRGRNQVTLASGPDTG
ncbi:GGDEF domain-containing protein [Neptunomonas qingdaonensis]|uniref:diguanylate cyclase n=1 Tax=Neptunomonas qingdaonensis TaxID=1045558 RepID=A0A1I2NNU0_9GAMM|nr:GGDEF domain-containing protein [Neptunomonas qingdaonensis]SFG05308.1 diguanylate cyclase (GGDEF) domain-containing protein [Neptunomonas qingdaonensis]